ncbi:hypothetical protein VaNZ11_004998 [Volvox africanus]|uniref:Uncharacterized protein n=1 Tax=Volvox africanus TaxID=51714 RepID=A0ABQ5RY98_9CHLO|nr:hypothetical protein VaNZ11_004998 [Volvox africanus]
MAQQSQPVVPFNALKPATWGSLKLLPLALRSKLTGTKVSDDAIRVGIGKENAVGQSVILQAPPKLGDLSHLHAIGPRRSVNQRYVLQPNLSVTRPMLAAHAPGLSSLLLPGMAPIVTQHSKQQHQQQEQATARQQTPMRQRSSTPSSPSLRGRQPQANPNFAPPASNISTRLPTPVRINASPTPSPTNVAPMLPKPPSPSRSLSQVGAPLANPFACASACSSPSASNTISNTFMLPNPPSILTNIPPPRVTPVQPQQAAPRSILSPVPWASGPAQSNVTPTSVRPSPSVPERSILASVQLINQQPQRSADADASAMYTSASTAALPGHSEWLPPVAAPAPSIASPVLSAPGIQAALQQALQGAVERKPEAFRVDNFESFFDSMMHPGDTGKLDGPLPHELTDDIRYSDAWYKHCREWNMRNKPITPYSAPVSAVCQTTSSCQFASTPFVVEKLVVAQQPKQQQESDGHGLQQQQQWSVEDAPMSDACCKALDIAHHGLSKVLTPTSRSRSASDMTGVSEGGGTMHQQPFTQCTIAVAEGDCKAPSGAQKVVCTAAALTSALETLARDQNPVATTAIDGAPRGDDHVGLQRRLAPALNLVASGTAAPLSAAAVHEANNSGLDNSAPADTDAAAMITGAAERCAVQVLNTALPLVRRKFAVPVLQLSILDAPMLPRASGAALSPAPDSARPPSTAATTPGPRTPTGGAAESAATTAATTPVGRDAAGAPTTPTTATARSNAAVSPFFESTNQPVLINQEPHAAAAAVAVLAAVPLRRLSHELAAAESVADRPSQAVQPGVPLKQSSSLAAQHVAPLTQTREPATDLTGAYTGTWSPGFPPPALAPPAAVPSTSTAVITVAQQRPPSPVTLLQNAPRDMPTPNPAFFNSSTAAPGAGASSLAAAVTAVAELAQSRGPLEQSSAGPSMSAPSAPADPLKEIVVGIEKLSTLKQNILAEDKEVDVTSITQMIQLKLAVEQLLARTSSAVQDATSSQAVPSTVEATQAGPAAATLQSAAAAQAEQHGHVATPKKHSRTATFGAFLKSVFSPRSGSASKAQATAATTAPAATPAPVVPSTLGTNTSSLAAAVPASPSTTAVGIRAPRPMSASALPGNVPSPSLADKSRYAALHQRAAARLAEAAAEPAGTRPAQAAAAGAAGQGQRGGVWQRYEEKIALHRHQLDTTKAQLDEAVRKLNDMQAEFDELLLCLGMESAKNKALCDAMRAAGLDPEPILAAIEEQWMSGVYS